MAAKLTFNVKVKMSKSRNQRVPWGGPSESSLCREAGLSPQNPARKGNGVFPAGGSI